jgi:hypothetical protein
VTTVVEVFSVQDLVYVWIAARPQQVVATGAVFVDLVVDGVVGDGNHRPEIRQAGPQSIKSRNVSPMQLLGAGRPEPFSGIVKAPGVEVGHLWPFHHNDAA